MPHCSMLLLMMLLYLPKHPRSTTCSQPTAKCWLPHHNPLLLLLPFLLLLLLGGV